MKSKAKEELENGSMRQAQKDQLKALQVEFKRLQKQLETIHKKVGYEDLKHGVLALQIAEHTVEETLEHTAASAERFRTSQIPKHIVEPHNGTRALRAFAPKVANFLKLTRARI